MDGWINDRWVDEWLDGWMVNGQMMDEWRCHLSNGRLSTPSPDGQHWWMLGTWSASAGVSTVMMKVMKMTAVLCFHVYLSPEEKRQR